MKKLALVFVVLAFVAVNGASAEMVDIGLGEMEQSELITLKAMIQGRQPDTVPVHSTPLDRLEQYGMAAMTRADFQALRDKMAGRNVGVDARSAAKPVRMVNIGTGEMPMDEFIALKNMVEGTDFLSLDHLAAVQP